VKWGRRSLEDNWRRKNKGTVEMGVAAENIDNNAGTTGTVKIEDIHTPGYYLQNIPLSDSMMQASHRMIEESLYAAGYIYTSDFAEYAQAATQYEDLIRRYPKSVYVVPAYYYLYQLYNRQEKAAEAEKYKNRLLAEAPESVYVKMILDPSYLDKLAQQKGESEQLYEQTYTHYNRNEYQSVIHLATDAITRFAKDALVPKFAYLKAVAEAKIAGTDEAMRAGMKNVIASYPQSEMAGEAQKVIDLIDGEDPAMKQADQVERAKTLYTYNEVGAYYFGWMVDAKENLSQLNFDLLSFNIEHFINVELEVVRNNINNTHVLLMVTGFADMQRAQGYYRAFVMEPELTKNVLYAHTPFIISESNYAILQQDKKVEDYIEFFKKEYLKQ
jgi:TolA-binding protein